MKIYLFVFTLILSYSTHAQEYNKVVEYEPGKKMLLGKVNLKAFDSEDFAWWKENYDNYHPNDYVVEQIRDSINDYSVKVFFGSWCGDSKRNVPKFFNILDKAGYDTKNVEIIALDKRDGAYKQSPTHEEKGLNIHRVPTFIFYKDGQEVSRIVERAHSTIENDIKYILEKKEQSSPYYAVAEYVINLMKQDTIEKHEENLENLAIYLSDYVKGSKELNTLGSVLQDVKRYKKAEFVYKLNAMIFPYKSRTHGSLASIYYDQKEYRKALTSYYKSLSIYPGNHFDDEITEINAILKKQKEEADKKKSKS